jgi:NAD(P)-dependent dehydrogenase (short-subunit alcohol dehydrogenase family)
LKDKVVIITGGTSGIGRAAARSFAEHGAKVLITGRRSAPLRLATGDHPHIAGVTADVSIPADAARTITETLNTWGRVDILVNNAGAGAILSLADARADKITSIFAVNVGPAGFPRRRSVLAAMKGSIVNVSSTFGSKPAAGAVALRRQQGRAGSLDAAGRSSLRRKRVSTRSPPAPPRPGVDGHGAFPGQAQAVKGGSASGSRSGAAAAGGSRTMDRGSRRSCLRWVTGR